MKLPTYWTIEDYTIQETRAKNRVLKAYSFVKPIHSYYLPSHITDSYYYKSWFDPKNDVWVYCSFGIIMLPKTIVKEVTDGYR